MPPVDAIPPSNTALDHERLMTLINSIADGVIAVDESLIIVLYNAAALNLLDVNTNIRGKHINEVLHLYTNDQQLTPINELIKSTKITATSRDHILHYHDGSIANLYLSIAPVRPGFGQTGQQGFVLVFRDITKEKSLEEERDEFISVISHELRTPVTVAEGNVSNALFTIEKSNNTADLTSALNEAHEQIVFLSDMINDLATLSRAERGRLSFEASSIDPQHLVTELVNNLQPSAKKKGLDLHTELPNDLTGLHTSALYLREILQNLIVNAIKYTEQGSVTVTAEASDQGVLFTVRDSGIGISKGDQEKVFNKFFRSEDYRTRKTKGTGLGLYVTKKLIALLHGTITLDSELNRGSTFRVYVPNQL